MKEIKTNCYKQAQELDMYQGAEPGLTAYSVPKPRTYTSTATGRSRQEAQTKATLALMRQIYPEGRKTSTDSTGKTTITEKYKRTPGINWEFSPPIVGGQTQWTATSNWTEAGANSINPNWNKDGHYKPTPAATGNAQNQQQTPAATTTPASPATPATTMQGNWGDIQAEPADDWSGLTAEQMKERIKNALEVGGHGTQPTKTQATDKTFWKLAQESPSNMARQTGTKAETPAPVNNDSLEKELAYLNQLESDLPRLHSLQDQLTAGSFNKSPELVVLHKQLIDTAVKTIKMGREGIRLRRTLDERVKIVKSKGWFNDDHPVVIRGLHGLISRVSNKMKQYYALDKLYNKLQKIILEKMNFINDQSRRGQAAPTTPQAAPATPATPAAPAAPAAAPPGWEGSQEQLDFQQLQQRNVLTASQATGKTFWELAQWYKKASIRKDFDDPYSRWCSASSDNMTFEKFAGFFNKNNNLTDKIKQKLKDVMSRNQDEDIDRDTLEDITESIYEDMKDDIIDEETKSIEEPSWKSRIGKAILNKFTFFAKKTKNYVFNKVKEIFIELKEDAKQGVKDYFEERKIKKQKMKGLERLNQKQRRLQQIDWDVAGEMTSKYGPKFAR